MKFSQRMFQVIAEPAPRGGVTKIDGATDIAAISNSISVFQYPADRGTATSGPVAIAANSTTNTAYIFMEGINCMFLGFIGSSRVLSFDVPTAVPSSVYATGPEADCLGLTVRGVVGFSWPNAIAVDAVSNKVYVTNCVGHSIGVMMFQHNLRPHC